MRLHVALLLALLLTGCSAMEAAGLRGSLLRFDVYSRSLGGVNGDNPGRLKTTNIHGSAEVERWTTPESAPIVPPCPTRRSTWTTPRR